MTSRFLGERGDHAADAVRQALKPKACGMCELRARQSAQERAERPGALSKVTEIAAAVVAYHTMGHLPGPWEEVAVALRTGLGPAKAAETALMVLEAEVGDGQGG